VRPFARNGVASLHRADLGRDLWTGYTAGRMRRFRIRSIVGDRVHVEMSAYDLSKGRVVYREKLASQTPGQRRRNFRR